MRLPRRLTQIWPLLLAERVRLTGLEPMAYSFRSILGSGVVNQDREHTSMLSRNFSVFFGRSVRGRRIEN
jgi:hypothetical protein